MSEKETESFIFIEKRDFETFAEYDRFLKKVKDPSSVFTMRNGFFESLQRRISEHHKTFKLRPE